MTERTKPNKQPDQDYNELDQTDESLKAEDITRAGNTGQAGGPKAKKDCPGETPQKIDSPCAPDGKSADRYAG